MLFRGLAIVIVMGSLLSGCAGRMRLTEPLSGVSRSLALTRFHDFMDRACSRAVDADVTLSWKALGKKQAIPGTLQAQEPAFLRYTVVDPLGRALLIFDSDGATFTLADTQKGEGYTGPVASRYWHKYIPEGIQPEDLFYWLGGRLRPGRFQVIDVRKGDVENDRAVWVILKSSEGLTHHVLFDADADCVLRHVIEDRQQAVMLDVIYTGMKREKDGCGWPDELSIEGEASKGTIRIHFDRIFSQAVMPPSTFVLALPDYYLIHKVQ